MTRRRKSTAIAVGIVLTMGLSACGGSGTSSDSTGAKGSTTTPKFNAALEAVYNPSDAKGGTVKLANSGDWDSLDTADTYYGYSWNFARLYSRALLTFKVEPGPGSNEVTPDLAEGVGVPNDDLTVWTYKIRPGLKYSDGTEIKAADVKYAVERSFDKEVFPDGYTYFNDFLAWPDGYEGAYKSPDVDTDSAIEVPDDTTVIFKLKAPLSSFDFFATLPATAPVPKAKDTGANYKTEYVSSGPYMFDENNAGKNFSLKRNPNWVAESDPIRKALPERFEVSLNVNADDIDNQVLSGDLDIDIAGTGVQPAAQTKVLADPALKDQTDNPTLSRLWYTSINGNVAPLDNVDCRKAVEFAVDKTGYQTAYGGEFSGGQIATTVLPPTIPGYEAYDLYPSEGNKGDVTKAKEALTACGQPDGFTTNISYRAERPKEKATAEALQQSLAKVGITLTLKPYPQGDYFSQYAGNPPYAKANNLGLAVNGWGADWNDGFGFLSQVVDSRVIRDTGGSSNVSVRDKGVDDLLDQAVAESDETARNKLWGEIDKLVMEGAYILPGVYAKSLLIRPKNLTNVFVSEAYSMYDYTSIGVQQ